MYCDYHGERGHNTNDCYQLRKQIEEAVASGKLAHLVKDIHRNNQRNGNPGRNGVKVINMIRQEGNRKRSFEERRSGETYHPLGVIDLRVTLGKEGRSKTVLMKFAIIKCRSPYNIIIGRTRMRILGAMGSTIHSIIPTNQGVVTMETSREALQECKHLKRVQGSWKEVQWRQCKEQMSEIREQYVTMGTTLTTNCKQLLADVLWENREEGLIRKVQYPEWIANTIPIKLANRTWKVQIDYSSLNKVCSKDMYPLPEEEDDEEKTGFHTEEGIYCFTHMPKELTKLRCYTSEDDGKDRSDHVLIQSEGRKVSRPYGNRRRTKGISLKNTCNHLKPYPRSPNQIRSLFLQLTAISKFILKLTELKHPIREARTRMEIAKEFVLTNETEKALRMIKRKLSKLQTLAIPKEGEDLMTGSKEVLWSREQVEEIPDSNKGRIFELRIILISLEEKMYSYAIRLKFKASNHAMDCEALLAGLAASANQGLETIKLEFLNQEVSVGIKTRPSVEETSSSKKGKETSKALGAKPNCNHEASGSN
nr:reverse transcriptase domain-containing protein [Tanacetum cinerariifolium]